MAYRIIEVVRNVEDAKEYSKQLFDANHEDISLLANPERALLFLYKRVQELEKPKRGRPRKNP